MGLITFLTTTFLVGIYFFPTTLSESKSLIQNMGTFAPWVRYRVDLETFS